MESPCRTASPYKQPEIQVRYLPKNDATDHEQWCVVGCLSKHIQADPGRSIKKKPKTTLALPKRGDYIFCPPGTREYGVRLAGNGNNLA